MKAHAYLIYMLRKSFKWAWADGWDEWKAVLFVSVATLYAGFTLTNVVSIALHHRIALAEYASASIWPFWIFACCVIFPVNYYLSRRGSQFSRQFRYQSKSMRILGFIVIWTGIILIPVAAFWTGSLVKSLPY